MQVEITNHFDSIQDWLIKAKKYRNLNDIKASKGALLVIKAQTNTLYELLSKLEENKTNL